MSRREFLEEVKGVVEDFEYVENGEASDFVVKGARDLFVILCEEDAAKLSKRKAGTGTMMARSIGAKPLVVSKKHDGERIIDETAYEKYNLPVVNPATLELILQGEKIYVRKVRSMFVVKINSKKLKERRIESNMSIGMLANLLGVSRKSVYEYERGDTHVSVDVAVKLGELFGDDILEPVDFGEFKGVSVRAPPHSPLEAELLERTDSVHVPKGKVHVGGSAGDVEFTATLPHGKDDLEFFAEVSKLINRKAIAVGFDEVPKELEDVGVDVAPDLESFFVLVRKGSEGEA